jgi:lysophospholipase L1-like esterase
MNSQLPTIFVIGDSISMHYGLFLEQYLRGTAQYARLSGEEEAMRDLDLPKGGNGGDSTRVLNFLRAFERSGTFHPDLLLINCGLHDIKVDPPTGQRQVPLDLYEKNLKQIAQLGPRLAGQMLWIRTTPCDEAVHNKPKRSFHRFAADCKAYNAAADRIMAGAGIPRIDLHGFTVNLGENLYLDHVHYPVPIREKQAAFLAGWVQAFL